MHIFSKPKTDAVQLHELHGKKKLQYIWDYYKLPLLLAAILIYIICYLLYGHFTRKEILLSAALVNVAPNQELTEQLSSKYLEYRKLDSQKKELQLYTGLYLTDNPEDPNHEYTYASRMKILGAIDSEALDVVFMNKEAFDAFSQNGYLANMENLLSRENEDFYKKMKNALETNTVILEDNAMELHFDDSISYSAKTEKYPMALELSDSPLFKNAGLNGTVYLGVIANSPHQKEAVSYIQYLYQ